MDQAEGRFEAKVHLSSGSGTRRIVSALLDFERNVDGSSDIDAASVREQGFLH